MSPDEALDFLRKLESEKPSVRIMFFATASSPSLSATGAVKSATAAGFSICADKWELTLETTGAGFWYSDPREAPDKVKEEAASKFDSCLDITFPEGHRCLLMVYLNDDLA